MEATCIDLTEEFEMTAPRITSAENAVYRAEYFSLTADDDERSSVSCVRLRTDSMSPRKSWRPSQNTQYFSLTALSAVRGAVSPKRSDAVDPTAQKKLSRRRSLPEQRPVQLQASMSSATVTSTETDFPTKLARRRSSPVCLSPRGGDERGQRTLTPMQNSSANLRASEPAANAQRMKLPAPDSATQRQLSTRSGLNPSVIRLYTIDLCN